MTEYAQRNETQMNEEFFFRIGEARFIPQELTFYARGGLIPRGDNHDSQRLLLSQQLAKMVRRAPAFLQDRLFYRPYCQEYGLMTVKDISLSPGTVCEIKVPQIPFEEMDITNLVTNLSWLKFMERYVLPRMVLIQNVEEVINMIPRIDARYNYDDIKLFDKCMQLGGYKIALNLVKDPTEYELKRLFNNATTLALINSEIEKSGSSH